MLLKHVPHLNLSTVIIPINISVIKIPHDQFSGFPIELSNLKKHFLIFFPLVLWSL